MAIDTITLWQITCDICGAPGPVGHSRTALVMEAQAIGYGIEGGDFHCPSCLEMGEDAWADADMINVRIAQ